MRSPQLNQSSTTTDASFYSISFQLSTISGLLQKLLHGSNIEVDFVQIALVEGKIRASLSGQ
ncbi:MAG TPA: hypothetical protein DCS24_08405 [Erythrobacter sp.]|nr:hypothetical protein [Erythrobacter sp.]